MAQLFGLARLGRDAELRSTNNGDSVASLSLAFSYGRKGDDGKRPTQWVDGSLWGKLADALAPYLLKGTQVSVTVDDVHIEQYKKGDGSPGVKLTGRVSAIELASGGGEQRTAPQTTASREPARRHAPEAKTGFHDMDNDIPF